MEKFKINSLAILIICIIFISACNLRDTDPDPVIPTLAYVSLYHASPDGPPLNVLMENNRINFYPLRYTDHTGYLNFYSGERNMRVGPSNASNIVIDTLFNFVEGEAYSLFYVNQYIDLKALLVEDDFVLPAAGEAAVRFIHLSPDAPAVNLVRISGDDSMEIAGNSTYLQASDYVTVASGIQSYEVRSADSDQVVLSIPDVNLGSRGVYTFVARGFFAPPAGNTNILSAEILVNN